MSPAALPPSLYQPTATATNTTTLQSLFGPATPSVASRAAGQPSGFPTHISLKSRNESPEPTHYLNSTAIDHQQSDSITIEPSKYTAEPESDPASTAIPDDTAAELRCMEEWRHHHPRPPCTAAEKEQASRDGENFMVASLAFGILSVTVIGGTCVYKAREMMRDNGCCGGSEAGYGDEEGALLGHDKED